LWVRHNLAPARSWQRGAYPRPRALSRSLKGLSQSCAWEQESVVEHVGPRHRHRGRDAGPPSPTWQSNTWKKRRGVAVAADNPGTATAILRLVKSLSP